MPLLFPVSDQLFSAFGLIATAFDKLGWKLWH